MSVAREAFALPAIFLTVALLGGLRIDAEVHLVPPSLMSLVLGMLLMGALVRSRVFAPDRLLGARRTTLENLSGSVVLGAVLAASAQIFNLVTPDTGLLHVIFAAFLLIQLLTTLAGGGTRASMLRSLLVLLGSAFILRFVVLEGLYTPQTGTLKRLLTALLQGVSLGAIDYHPHAATTGYVAFFTIALYMTGLVALPAAAAAPERGGYEMQQSRRGATLVLLCLMICTAACGDPPLQVAAGKGNGHGRLDPADREAALAAAIVWRSPTTPIGLVDFTKNPEAAGGFMTTDDVACRFVVRKSSGLTPKFYCQLPDGDVIKVKYGARNAEVRAEVAATRLLAALGFGADSMHVVRKVKCAGCPASPFRAAGCYLKTGLTALCFAGGLDYDKVREFDPVVIERPMEGRKLEAEEDQGWAWHELIRIDPARGGSSRADVDALRLLAILLAHWDNKAANQRLICPSGADGPDGGCAAPLAIVADVGATFGPTKVDLQNWRARPVWADGATCDVSMRGLPWNGATFPDTRISEGGRLKILGLLVQLSDQQLLDLFIASRIIDFDQVSASGRDAAAWVKEFQDKVAQIRQAGPCPPSS